MEAPFLLPLLGALLLASGCVSSAPPPSGASGVPASGDAGQAAAPDLLYQADRMGNLCSSLSGCFVFCKDHVGSCTQFCAANPSHPWCGTLPKAGYPPWIPDQIVQPLPEGASSVRLVLPAPLDNIDLPAIGAHGAHPGGHAEGLDHEWISIDQGIPVTSWADGEVVYARPNNGPQDTEYRIIIYYGDGLWGEHMHVAQPLVQEGDRVQAGDPVAYGEAIAHAPGMQSAEFNVADQHRQDGTTYWYKFVKGAMLVSPFDYLREDVQQALKAQWQAQVLDPYASKGAATFGVVPTPWEPYLSNPILFHAQYPGELTGEWFLRSRPWTVDAVPDILVFLPALTRQYPKQRVLGTEDSTASQFLSGDWEADYRSARFTITAGETTSYGIFAVDESRDQAVLTIEYQEGSYPSAFSGNALTYTERELVSKGEERHYWDYPEDRMAPPSV